MEPLERYFARVGHFLPRSQQQQVRWAMEILDGNERAGKSLRLRSMTQFLALAAVLAFVPGALRALAPVTLTLLEILLGIAQASLAFLRANGF
jgi:hypothetical protein